MKNFRCIVVLLLGLVATSLYAQEEIYVGIGLGAFDYDESFTDVIYGNVSDTAPYRKLYAGFEFHRFFALEISYGEIDAVQVSGTSNVPPFGQITGALRGKFDITSLKGIGQLPLDWGVLLGGLGIYSADLDFNEVLDFDCCGIDRNSIGVSDDGMTAMVGIEWRWGRFGTRWAARLEYEWWDMTDVDTSNVGLGISYGF